MPITRNVAPKASVHKLLTTIEQLTSLRKERRNWMRIRLASIGREHILYPHPVYHAQLQSLLDGRTLRTTLRRIAWMYFLRNVAGQLACVEISSVGGKHKNVRLTEGSFVTNVFNAIEESQTDRRLRGRPFQLRSVRMESLHAFVLWFKATGSVEYWVPVTQIGSTHTVGRWLIRKEFVELLISEAQRVADAHKRALQLAGSDPSVR
jgi:hypothetical protein